MMHMVTMVIQPVEEVFEYLKAVPEKEFCTENGVSL